MSKPDYSTSNNDDRNIFSDTTIPNEIEHLSLEKITTGIREAGFHSQRLRIGLDAEPPRLHLPIETWKEFCATAKALNAAVIFYVTESLTETDFTVGTGQKLLWKVLPETEWLEQHIGHLPTALYYVFFEGGVLEFRQDTIWWLRAEPLWEQAMDAVKQGDQQERQQERQLFLTELQRVLPEDDTFRQIALLPRPPITAIRNRIIELFQDQRFIASLNLEILDIVKQIKTRHKTNKSK